MTGKIQQIDLNYCFDMKTQTNLSVGTWVRVVGLVQCLKSQIFSNSLAKNRHDLFANLEGEVDGTKCGFTDGYWNG